MKLNLQFFGGRGASAGDGGTPEGGPNGKQNFQGNVGGRVYGTAAEALGKQGKAKGIEDATLRANPNYNPAYSEYSENCQRCVIAYEARRRGYDVVAHPTYPGDTMPQGDNYLTNFSGAKKENVGATTKAKVLSNVESKMASYGDGARGIIEVQWQGAGFGHVFNCEQKGGKTMFRDAQTGKYYQPKNVFQKVKPSSVRLTRVDNLQFTDTVGQSVTKDKF